MSSTPTTASSFAGPSCVVFNGSLTPGVGICVAGKHSVVIPSSLPAGDYLLRAEIIALHVAQTYPGAQFVCAIAYLLVVIDNEPFGRDSSTSAVPRSRSRAAEALTRQRLPSREPTSPLTPVSRSTSTTTFKATLREYRNPLSCRR